MCPWVLAVIKLFGCGYAGQCFGRVADRVVGEVEVDETYIGEARRGKTREEGMRIAKTLVVVATECLWRKLGRVRFRCVNQAAEDELIPFINYSIDLIRFLSIFEKVVVISHCFASTPATILFWNLIRADKQFSLNQQGHY
jgi:hypothetical protein